jgi:endoglycosylceramidase
MRFALRILALTFGALLLVVVVAVVALGVWLHNAAHHKGEPDRVVPFLEHPSEPAPRVGEAEQRWRVSRVGDRHEILDAQGRVVILRGVNIGQGSKTPPFRPIAMGDDQAFAQLRDWGFNAIRFISTWEALEPRPMEIDLEYVHYVKWFLDAANRHGMVVILDNHHNEVSRCFGGDFAPVWAHRKGTIPPRALERDCLYMGWSGIPELPLQLRWWADFLDALWTPDELTLQDHVIRSWVKLAEVVQGHPALLGYGPFNEPHCYPGWFTRFFHPGKTDCEDALSDYYRRFSQAIRAVDPDALIFFEPPLRMLEPDWDGTHSGLTRPPVDGTVFSVHYYNGKELTATCDWTWNRQDCNLKPFLDRTRELAARQFDSAVVLTEFGAHWCKQGAAQDLSHQMVDIEDARVSSFVWNYWKTGDTWGMTGPGEGGEDMSLVIPEIYARYPDDPGRPRCFAGSLVRPYPMRVPGPLVHWSFDRSFENWRGDATDHRHDGTRLGNTDVFTFAFRESGGTGDTLVWVPRKLVYGDDRDTEAPAFTVTVSDGTWKWSTGDSNVMVWTTDSSVPEHTLTIKPWGGRRAPGNGVGDCVDGR